MLGVDSETELNEVVKLVTEFLGFGEAFCWVLLDDEHCPEGVNMGVRRFAFGHFDGGDAKRPNIGLFVIFRFGYYFWTHPEGRADDGVFVCQGMQQLRRNSEISQFDVPFVVEKNIAGFNVAVYFFVIVKVFQSLEGTLQDRGNLLFVERFGNLN